MVLVLVAFKKKNFLESPFMYVIELLLVIICFAVFFYLKINLGLLVGIL